MKKVLILFLVAILLLGCSSKKKQEADNLIQYKSIYSNLLDNDRFISTSDSYSIEVVMNKIDTSDGSAQYRWTVIIDNPKVAMYQVQALAIIDSLSYDAQNMMPSYGIFSNYSTNMIPNQSNVDLGFIKGIGLDGIVTQPLVNLRVTVSWYDSSKLSQHRENFQFVVQYQEPAAS